MVLKVIKFQLLIVIVAFSSTVKAQCGTVISTFPYSEDFEAAPAWTSGGTNSDWAWGTPAHPIISSAGGGTKSWTVGGLTGSFYNYSEQSWIMSPCFDFTTLNYPWISFKIFWEDEWKFDGMTLQYSTNGGTTWANVGAYGDAVNCLNANWYNYNNITWLTTASPKHGWTGRTGPTAGSCQGGNGSLGWVTAKHCMSSLAGLPSVRFRFLFGSGTTCNSFDGISIDDIFIDNAPPNVAGFTYACAGANTVTFTNTSLMCPTGYAWDFGDGATSTATNPSHTYAAPGTYNVTLTSSGPCNAPGSFTLPVTILGGTTSVTNITCNGANNGTAIANVSGGMGPFTYSWTPGGAATQTITGLSAGTYTVSVSAADACPTTLTAAIVQPAILTATTNTTAVSCSGGNNGTAIVTPIGGTTPYTYSWNPGSAVTSTASGLTAGTYTVTVTDAHSCTTTATAAITEPVALSVSSVNTAVNCFGGTDGTASATSTGGTTPYTYSWIPSGSTTANPTGLSAGGYTVTVTDAHLCTATTSGTITQPIALTVSVVNNAVTCYGGANGNATASPAGGAPPYSYLWMPGATTTPTTTGLIAGNYTVTITDTHSCTTTATTIITQPSAFTVSTTNTPVSCFGGTDGTTTAIPTGGTAAYSYLWAPGGVTTSTATGLSAGTYTVTITDAHSCTASTTSAITQPTILSASVITTAVSCFGGNNGTAIVNASGGSPAYSYAWTPGGSTISNPGGLSSGTYTVTITDTHSCTTTATGSITQPALPVSVSAVNTPVSCFGGNNGTATATANGGTTPFIYAWTPSGGTNAAATGLIAGTYTVTAIDANGCSNTINTTISQPTTAIAVTTSNTPSICGLNNGTATAAATGGIAPYTYIWSPAGGTNATASGLLHGIYSVTVADANGCTIVENTTIADTGNITTSIITTPISCYGDTNGTATASTIGGSAPYLYTWNSGSTGSTLANLRAGSYCVTVVDAIGCRDTACVSLANPPQIEAEFTTNTSVADIYAPDIHFIDLSSAGVTSWQWNFGDTTGTNIQNPTHSFPYEGTFPVTLIVINAQGCTDTATHQITINDGFTFYAPNAFTPNGDGMNETFLPKGTGWDPNAFDLWIFDRWGNMIFHTTDMNSGWNGKNKSGSTTVLNDVYVWKVQITDILRQPHYYIGSVTIAK